MDIFVKLKKLQTMVIISILILKSHDTKWAKLLDNAAHTLDTCKKCLNCLIIEE